MTAIGAGGVRKVVDNAELVPPPLAGYEPQAGTAPRIAAALPIGLLGLTTATTGESVDRYGIGEGLSAYRDARGRTRFLTAAQHDRIGIRSLFLFHESRLQRLWPPKRERQSFDLDRAVTALMMAQGQIGLYRRPAGEIIATEPPGYSRALLGLARQTQRTLALQTDPLVALDLVRAWVAEHCLAHVPDAEIVATVNHLCGLLLRGRQRANRV